MWQSRKISLPYSYLPLDAVNRKFLPKDNIISTFDPLKLKTEIFNVGGGNFLKSFLTPIHTIFHINRIEDFKRIITVPLHWEKEALPYRLNVFNFFFITKGISTRNKGLNTYVIGENTFFFLPAYEITSHQFTNAHAEGYYCHFHFDLLASDFKPKDLLAEFPFLNFNCHPLISVSPEMREEDILPILQRLEKEYRKGEKCRQEILQTYLVALFTELKPFVTVPSVASQSSAYHITEQYKKALSQFIYEKQKVNDYADMLAVSPNHLNRCVKTVTGRSAHDLLSEMILLEAKVLLKQTSLSISEIAFQLGRSEISDFTRFFKSKTGISPGEYRKMVNPSL